VPKNPLQMAVFAAAHGPTQQACSHPEAQEHNSHPSMEGRRPLRYIPCGQLKIRSDTDKRCRRLSFGSSFEMSVGVGALGGGRLVGTALRMGRVGDRRRLQTSRVSHKVPTKER